MQVYEILLTEEHQKGVDWEAIVNGYESLGLMTKDGYDLEGDNLEVGTVTKEDYVVLLDALETVGEAIRLNNTEQLIGNGMESKLFFDTAELSQKIEGTDLSFNIGLNPKIKEGEVVSIELMPELHLSSLVRQKGSKSSDNKAIVTKSNISINAKKEEVIVIGGLVDQKRIKRISKFPLLGDIPFMGSFFRRENEFSQNVEYVIFFTQEIIKEHSEEGTK